MEDFASAAARHWDHAEFLGQAGRWQEAAYLAGYIAECSLKTLIEHTDPGIILPKLRHDLAALSGEALEIAVLLNPASRRYQTTSLFLTAQGIPWRPEDRYEQTGFREEAQLRNLVEQAEEIGTNVLVNLFLDGILEEVPE